jgi:hypothetical protein
MYAQIATAISGADKQDINLIKPVCNRVGIKFDNISAGKSYPGKFVFKNIHGWVQKEVTSHL